MSIYLFILVLLMLGSVCDLYNVRIKNVVFNMNFFFVFLLATLRYGVGADYFQYVELFDNALPISIVDLGYFTTNKHDLEFGYLFFESIIKEFTNNYDVFLFLYNIVMFSLLHKGIKYFYNHNIQLFLFYCLVFTQYVLDTYRQAMAIAVFLYSIRFLINRNLIKYIICIMISFSFHKVSILLLPLYFLYGATISNSFLSILCLISISFLFSYFDITGKIINILYIYFNDSSIVRRVHFYYIVRHDPSLSISLLAYIQRGLLITIILFFFNRMKDSNMSVFILLYPISFFLFSNVGILAGRISAMFFVFYLSYFSILFSKKFKYKKLLLVFLFFYMSSIFYKDIHIIHPIRAEFKYIPYQTILFDR